MQRRLYWASKALIQNFPICVGYMVKDQFELMLFSKSWKYTSTNTAKNTVITPDFLVWKLCGKAQFPHSFRRFAHNYAKLCLSAKFPHQEIRWNYGIFCSGIIRKNCLRCQFTVMILCFIVRPWDLSQNRMSSTE